MKTRVLSVMILLCLAALAANTAFGQDTFNDPAVSYQFSVPDTKWKMTVKPSATSPNVEYVYGDRFDGHLQVRKLTVAKDSILTDIVHEEENSQKFKQGFVPGREENFAGKLRGSIYNFEYVAGGRNMSGRFYFLKANETTVYVLRFTGQKDSLKALKNQTDSIARTFGIRS